MTESEAILELKQIRELWYNDEDMYSETMKVTVDEDCINGICKAITALEKVQQFEAIGTIERFRELTEKAEPKKPFQPFGTHSYKCPTCWKFVAHEVDDNCDLEAEMAGWCPYCSQRLDWQ